MIGKTNSMVRYLMENCAHVLTLGGQFYNTEGFLKTALSMPSCSDCLAPCFSYSTFYTDSWGRTQSRTFSPSLDYKPPALSYFLPHLLCTHHANPTLLQTKHSLSHPIFACTAFPILFGLWFQQSDHTQLQFYSFLGPDFISYCIWRVGTRGSSRTTPLHISSLLWKNLWSSTFT